MTPSMNTDNVRNLANSRGSNDRDHAVSRASVPDMGTTEEVGPRKGNEALNSSGELARINCFNIKTSTNAVANFFVVTVCKAQHGLSLLCSLAEEATIWPSYMTSDRCFFPGTWKSAYQVGHPQSHS